ncbi:transcription factor Adf-1-like [Armigeres subalbatus]|uniref:transcription factor Adf-1-like n=1 Tax=Armigeres subalbatus TaxID=124917 RepID=UPI002ECFD6B7
MASYEEKLIQLVKLEPCLYAKSTKAYRNNNLKEKAWASIASACDKSVDQVKSRWRSLRDRFGSLKRKLSNESRSGAAASCSPGWPLYNELVFLDSHMEARPTSSNYTSPSISQQISPSIDEEETEYVEDDTDVSMRANNNQDTETANEATPHNKEVHQTQKRVPDAVNAQMNNVLKTVQERVESWGRKRGRHERFALYLAEQMEQLPVQIARSLEVEFIAKVNQMIDEYENLQFDSIETTT